MRLYIKQRLLNYIKSNNDGSAEAEELIKKLEFELGYADCDVFSVCPDDLNGCGEQEALREYLGKGENDPYTMADCEAVADGIAELVSDEFGENLYNTISYR